MKKLFPVAIALLSPVLLASCDKGDDNPYGNWKCTCFVTTAGTGSTFVHTDTVVLYENDMDRNTAKSYCDKAKIGYDSLSIGRVADCKLK